MTLKVIHTDQAPEAIGPYSQAVLSAPLIFVSGQIGIFPETGELISSDFVSQTQQVLKNLRQILVEGGSDFDQVVAVDVFLTDIGNFSRFNEIYAEYFSDHRPARAVVEVSALPKDALVEIKCIARTSK